MAPCNPPLNFVQNGPAGSAFPPPQDPNDVPTIAQQPTFEQTACDLLGQDLCSSMDAISAIDELPALTDTIDALTTAADAQLDAILLELDQLGQDKVGQAFDDFAGAAPTSEGFLGGVTGISVPSIGPIPLTGPPPLLQGGPAVPAPIPSAAPGAAPYTTEITSQPWFGAGTTMLENVHLEGPNPPFADVQANTLGPLSAGQVVQWTVTVNPAAAGTFSGFIVYTLSADGITAQKPITVTVS